MRSSLWILAFICALCVVPPVSVLAETSNDEVAYELKEMKKALQAQNELIQKQQAKIEELERKVAAVRAESFDSAGPPTFPIVLSLSKDEGGRLAQDRPVKALGLPGQMGALLPEIGLVGDIVATSSEEGTDGDGNDRVSARAIELVLGSNVDPYSRFDATFHFSDVAGEEAEIDEAYLTRWGLPGEMTGRFGRFFPKIGKAAAGHRDALSTVDEPLVIRRYFGGEGYFRTGADLSRVLKGPFGWVLQPTAGVLEGGAGEGGTMLGTTRRRPTVYSHLKTFKEINDASNVELGLTHLVGSSDADPAFEVNALGVDATYLHHLTPVNPLKLQGELFVQQRDEAFSIDATTGATTQFDRHPWGAYALADYRFAPRWSAGVRADHVRLVDTGLGGVRHYDQGVSAFLTFYQSEWARWRLQFRHEERGPQPTDDSVMLQGTFAIGTHKHKLQ